MTDRSRDTGITHNRQSTRITAPSAQAGGAERGQPPAIDHASRVGTMFDGIAPRYDLLNRLMSAGQDGRWRAVAVAAMRPVAAGPLLDIGVGTGDLAFAMRRRFPRNPVTGIDLSGRMMGVARDKANARGDGASVALARGDVQRLPFPDRSFSGAATAFTLRNVAELPAALAEIERVLRPGAPFVCLEITRPAGGLRARLFTAYFRHLLPRITGVISRSPDAYRYLPQSVDRFVSGPQLAAALRDAGFERVRMRRFWPGPVTLHAGRRGSR